MPRSLQATLVASLAVVLMASQAQAVGAGSRIPWVGGSWYLLGADYPWNQYGRDFGTNAWGAVGVHTNTAAFDADFAAMQAQGIHVVRWWVFSDGRAGINFSGGLPTGLNSDVFPDMDAAVAIAARHHVYLNLVLLDFSLMFNPSVVSGVQTGGYANLINTAAGQAALINNVFIPLFQRYGSNPQILSYEVMNEPEWAISDDGAIDSRISQPTTLANFKVFVTAVAAAVHANTHSYVTVGEAAMKWASQWKGWGLDYYQIHYYDWMHPYSNTDLFDATYSSLSLDEPVVVGEYPAANSSTATFQGYLDRWFNNGYAGAWAWSFKHVDSAGAPDPTTNTNWNNAHLAAVNITPAVVGRDATQSGGPTAPTRQGAHASTSGTPRPRVPYVAASSTSVPAGVSTVETAALREAASALRGILAAFGRSRLSVS